MEDSGVGDAGRRQCRGIVAPRCRGGNRKAGPGGHYPLSPRHATGVTWRAAARAVRPVTTGAGNVPKPCGRSTMKANRMVLVFLTLGVGCCLFPLSAWAAEGKPEGAPRWEYRVLTKEQVSELGKNDLAAGLNKLGDDGWEVAVVDAAYIFKRPKDQAAKQPEDLKAQVAQAELDVEMSKDRVAWSERMARKGFLSERQVEAERGLLRKAEMALEKAQRELKKLPPDPKGPEEKERKPEK